MSRDLTAAEEEEISGIVRANLAGETTNVPRALMFRQENPEAYAAIVLRVRAEVQAAAEAVRAEAERIEAEKTTAEAMAAAEEAIAIAEEAE